MLKIALSQLNPCVGDIEDNARKIIGALGKAREQGADMVVFPELALCGYPPEDLLLKKHFVRKNKKFLQTILPHSKGILALIGFVDQDRDGLYNACAVVQDKKIVDIYHKVFLPNYGVFDEKRYFAHGDSLKFYTLGEYTFSVSICEDTWTDFFIDRLRQTPVDFVVNMSASPFHLGKIALREKMLSSVARRANAFVFYCNLVGGQDELIFDGTSKVFSPQGKLAAHARRFQEDMLLFTFNQRRACPAAALKVKEEEETYEALRLGLQDYVKKNDFKKVIVGVSGGIDSAVVVSLAALTLGPENVRALVMPSRFTSGETMADACRICDNLAVKYDVISIEKAFSAFQDVLKPWLVQRTTDKAEENVQARIRGALLMAFSNKFGYLVLNTGNKSELSCGYCTLYGDMVGGFGILKDLYKQLVYKLARYINRRAGKTVIPRSVIVRPPSAELRPDQRDSDTLPPYEVLDPILKLYIEEDLSLDQIVKKGFSRALVKKIISLVDASEYKRRQAAIGIKITPKAFGKDRRMPITNRFFL